ncbi:MAG: DUF697 domain-containing protein [Myxococcales bacterium]|nr:DUF697 domain-containing protein [Myxococcales bacterium]
MSDYVERARDQLRRLLAERDRMGPEERAHLSELFADLEGELGRLEAGEVRVAVFGEVSVGKSALLNALVGRRVFDVHPRGGWTREVSDAPWAQEVEGLAGARLTVLDTPGLNEVAGEEREALARAAAARADVILFVVDGDLTQSEYAALGDLLDLHKAVLVVLNKVDTLTAADRDAVLDALRRRLDGRVAPELIIPAAADPLPITVVERAADGSERTMERPRPPMIDALVAALVDILARDGKTVVALNALARACETSDRLGHLRVEVRRRIAEALIFKRSIAKAVAVAANPVPLLDVAGGMAADGLMVHAIGRVFGLGLTWKGADKIAGQIAAAAATVFGTHAALQTILSSAKIVPVVGQALVALPQGAVAYMFSQVLGRAAIAYFEQGASWGKEGPKTAVERIAKEVVGDPRSYLRAAAGRIRAELRASGEGA